MTVWLTMTEGFDSSEMKSKAGRDNNALTIVSEKIEKHLMINCDRIDSDVNKPANYWLQSFPFLRELHQKLCARTYGKFGDIARGNPYNVSAVPAHIRNSK